MLIMLAMQYKLMETISEEMATTNIRIDLKTKDRLSALGKHGDSFNSIIERLLDERETRQTIADQVKKGK